MITYTKNKIISDNSGKTRSVEIDEILWSVKSKSWFIARMRIALLLSKKLGLEGKDALMVASSMRADYETFYSLI